MLEVGLAEFFISPAYKLWPFGESTDFANFEHRAERVFMADDGREVLFKTRLFDICRFLHAANLDAETVRLYVTQNTIDNRVSLSKEILAAFDSQFAALAADGVQIAYWKYPYWMHRPIVELAKKHFKLIVLANADDTVESLEERTLPSVDLVNVYLYAAPFYEWDKGSSNIDLYLSKGVVDLRWLPLQCSISSMQRRMSSDEEIKEKCDRIRTMAPVFTWVGTRTLEPYGSVIRSRLLLALNKPEHYGRLESVGVKTNLFGLRMRDGVLEHKDLEGLYDQALFSVGLPYQSLLNNRLYDLSIMGVVQFQHDPRGELSYVGFEPGKHYIPYDGTVGDLINKVLHWKDRRSELSEIAMNAHEQMRKVLAPYVFDGDPLRKIVLDYYDRFAGDK